MHEGDERAGGVEADIAEISWQDAAGGPGRQEIRGGEIGIEVRHRRRLAGLEPRTKSGE